jgi:hypothetical protein
MFAGLPGFGVGTLFYVVVAFWMPIRELPRVARGTSSLARWRLIVQQLFYASGIVLTIMIAERFLMWALGQSGPQPFSPAVLLSWQLAGRAPGSILAAPITASLLMLGGVVLSVEVLRLVVTRRREPPTPATTPLRRSFPEEALDSPSR